MFNVPLFVEDLERCLKNRDWNGIMGIIDHLKEHMKLSPGDYHDGYTTVEDDDPDEELIEDQEEKSE